MSIVRNRKAVYWGEKKDIGSFLIKFKKESILEILFDRDGEVLSFFLELGDHLVL